jgi:tRNA(Arg) A34 adenosine deaminase TadA
MILPRLEITLPTWVPALAERWTPTRDDAGKMRQVVTFGQANVEHRTGGPFSAAVVERGSGELIAVGVNSVTRLNNSVLHAEVVALMLAEQRLGSFTLREHGCELLTSCEPCAMCLGAILWSGVQRVVCGASREDALALNFDEGPVFAESYRYMQERGIDFVHGVARAEARAVLEAYRADGGLIYNA